MIWISVIFVPANANIKSILSRHKRRAPESEFESRHFYDVIEPSATSYATYDTATPKESLTTFTAYERKSPSKNYQKHILSSNSKHQSPAASVEKKYNEKESKYKEEKHSPGNDKEYTYILTAGGKENVYEEDISNAHKPHEFQVSYPERPESESYNSGKRVSNYEKLYNRYQYSYSNQDTAENHPSLSAHSKQGVLKARSYNAETQRYAPSEDIPNKHPSWKKLGPNVEFTASAESPSVYIKPSDGKDKSRKTPKKRKNPNKGGPTKIGYTNQHHALYVANNVPSLKPTRGAAFDHNNVLRQSNKFELGDAMISEIEKEAPKRPPTDYRTRIKQESPSQPARDHQFFNFDPHHHQNHQSFAYFNSYIPQQQQQLQQQQQHQQQHQHQLPQPFLNAGVQSAAHFPKVHYPYLGGAFSKGFVRNIELETNSAGQRKTVPALIIPLSPEQVRNQYLHADMMSSAYVNNAEIVNHPKSNSVPFPYDFVNSKYPEGDASNSVLPSDNYQFQNFQTHQFKTVQNPEEEYSTYLNYPQTALFSKYSTPTPALSEGNKETQDDEYSSQSFYQNNEQRRNLPYSIVIPGSQSSTPSTVSNTAKADFKASEYYEEPNQDSKYLSQSESNYFSTVASTKIPRSSSSAEKKESRRN